MERYVSDNFKSDVRIVLTLAFCIPAVLAWIFGLHILSAAPLILAALTFQTRSRVVLDMVNRTYLRETGVFPLARIRRGPFEDIEYLLLTYHSGRYGRIYHGYVHWKKGVVGPFRTYAISSGTLPKVAEDVLRISKASGIPFKESDFLREERQALESVGKALPKPR